MILYREYSWWYWAVILALLFTGLAGRSVAFDLATALALTQLIHFGVRDGSISTFPVQVRAVYAAILLIGLLPSMTWLFWLPALGTFAMVAFGYCPLARLLSLLPWNRRERLSWRLVWRTFLAAPVKGNILQGLPAPN